MGSRKERMLVRTREKQTCCRMELELADTVVEGREKG